MEWYNSLIKPAWTPVPGVIGTIWTLLYPIIIVVFGYVIFRVVRGTMGEFGAGAVSDLGCDGFHVAALDLVAQPLA